MTMFGRVNYERMALIPSSKSYANKLEDLGHKGFIFPLDEALGLTRLPFNISISAMLEIAYEAIRSDSYEDAQQSLQRSTHIKVNDDTMRQVTNTIGTLVFNNDVAKSEDDWGVFSSGRLCFPEVKKDHTMYIEVDGAMLPTRQEDVKGVVYRENKLGIVFSSDNIYWWTNNHGNREYLILKKEYTPYISGTEQFTKLILSLAIKN